MRDKRWLKRNGAIVALVMTASVAAMISGCGKSADSLYTEGKELIENPETRARGLEMLAGFEKRFPNDPRTPEVILASATIHQSMKQYSEAESGFNRLIGKYPETAEAYKGMFLLGYMYYEDMQDTEKAKTVLNKFVAQYPDSGLTVSARVLLENIGLPVEEWSTVKSIMSRQEQPESAPPAAVAK